MELFVDCIGGWWWSWVLSDTIGVSEFHSGEEFHARHEEFPRSGRDVTQTRNGGEVFQLSPFLCAVLHFKSLAPSRQ